MNKFEVKYQSTAKKMNSALISLLERKDIKDITISEICQEAKVNRTTFYLHYDNILDLLQEIATTLFKGYLESFDKQIPIESYHHYSAKELAFNTPEYLLPFLNFVQKNKTIFKIFVTYPNIINIENIGGINLKKFFSIIMKKNGIQNETNIHYMTEFYLSGVTAIVLEWINNNCQDDMMTVCESISLCTRQIQS